MDSAIFPNPESYDPDRWISAAQEGVRLDRYLVSFSKGSRMCVGIKYVHEFSPPPSQSPSHSKRHYQWPFFFFLFSFFPKTPAHVNVMRSLAYAEFYLTLGTIFSRFELENFETTSDDVTVHRDFFVGMPKDGSEGVRATVTGKVKE